MTRNRQRGRVRRGHVGFAAFLTSAFLLPDVDLISGVGDVSLGIFGLLIWAAMMPQALTRFGRVRGDSSGRVLVIFAVYAIAISVASARFVATAYALQFAFFVGGTFVLGRAYYHLVARTAQLATTQRILWGVSAVYAIAVVVSVFTGPIYPGQGVAVVTERDWAGQVVSQGLGFAENHNVAGAVLLVFLALVVGPLAPARPRRRALVGGLIIVALAASLSRSAMIAGLGAGAFVAVVLALRQPALRRPNRIRPWVYGVWLVIPCLVFVGLILVAFAPTLPPVVEAVSQGIGLRASDNVAADIASRTDRWNRGVDSWADGSWGQRLLGQGFFNSMKAGQYGWSTPHNTYVAILGDFGLVGLALFVGFIGHAVATALKGVLRQRRFGAETAALGSMVALILHGMTGEFFYGPEVASLAILVVLLPVLRHPPANQSRVSASPVAMSVRDSNARA